MYVAGFYQSQRGCTFSTETNITLEITLDSLELRIAWTLSAVQFSNVLAKRLNDNMEKSSFISLINLYLHTQY